jgi:predicted outer membrane repeat protein
LQQLLPLVLAMAAGGVEVHVDPAGAWVDQVEAAGAGTTVVFAPGWYGGCSAEGLALANGVALAGSAGAAATVIDCGGAGRHFAVGGGASVRIKGLTLTGGVAPNGGNISSDGGCVLVEGSLVVVDSVFSNCSAEGWGGAIAARGSAAINVSRCNFTGNAAGEGGGAIHAAADYLPGGTLVVEDSVFSGCTAATWGGAIAVPGSAELEISRSTFTGNTAGEGGGGIYADAGNVSEGSFALVDSVFSDCGARGGGAISFWSSATLSTLRCTFVGTCTAEVHVDPAGAWADQVEAAGAGTTVVFAPGWYGGCSADGLALANDVALVGSAGAAATVIDCGGAGRHFVVGGGASVRIEGLTLTGGVAPDGDNISSDGGCVLVEGSLVVEDSVFSNCSAEDNGGAIAARGSAALNVSSSNVTGVAAHLVWAIHSRLPGSSLVVKDSVFSACTATWGGAIAVGGSAALNVSRSNFTGNAAQRGGAIHSFLPGRSLVVEDSVFSGCTAATYGGAIASRGSAGLNVSRSIFTGNAAGEDGGAINAYPDYLPRGSLVVVDSVFSVCTAEEYGGAIAARGSAGLDISRSIFTGNTAGKNGGGIYATAWNVPEEPFALVDSVFSDSVFSDCGAGSGGAMAVETIGTLNILRCNFTGNAAAQEGGALAVYLSSVSASRSRFERNTGGRRGGAVYGDKALLVMLDAVFHSNRVLDLLTGPKWGGEISHQLSNLTLKP